MITNVGFSKKNILKEIDNLDKKQQTEPVKNYGDGRSAELFSEILKLDKIWETPNQKMFNDQN